MRSDNVASRLGNIPREIHGESKSRPDVTESENVTRLLFKYPLSIIAYRVIASEKINRIERDASSKRLSVFLLSLAKLSVGTSHGARPVDLLSPQRDNRSSDSRSFSYPAADRERERERERERAPMEAASDDSDYYILLPPAVHLVAKRDAF